MRARLGPVRPRRHHIVLVTLALGVLMTASACSSDSSDSAGPAGDDAIRAAVRDRIDAVWRDAGVADEAQVLDYRRTDRPRASACAELPEDQRWWGKQTATLPPGVVSQTDLLDRLGTALSDEGFTVRRYRSTGSETRILDAVHDAEQTTVQLFVTGDGGASLDVKVGPCAPALRAEPDAPYVAEG